MLRGHLHDDDENDDDDDVDLVDDDEEDDDVIEPHHHHPSHHHVSMGTVTMSVTRSDGPLPSHGQGHAPGHGPSRIVIPSVPRLPRSPNQIINNTTTESGGVALPFPMYNNHNAPASTNGTGGTGGGGGGTGGTGGGTGRGSGGSSTK